MVEWKQKNTFVKLNFPVIESREEMIALGIRSNETLIIFNCFIWICTLVCIPMKGDWMGFMNFSWADGTAMED